MTDAPLYRDPASGETLTAEQVRTRYGQIMLDVLPPMAVPNYTAPDAPALVSQPSCIGCGCSVAARGDLCAFCQMKPQFQAPTATRELAPQSEPKYVREGNFRQLPSEGTEG
jgi:hypothetical protein